MVGLPFFRMVALFPWWMLRYQPLAGIRVVTPRTTRISFTIFPRPLATKSRSMYRTGPWLTQLPRWTWAACRPGVRPLAVTVTVSVRARELYTMVARPRGVPYLVP